MRPSPQMFLLALVALGCGGTGCAPIQHFRVASIAAADAANGADAPWNEVETGELKRALGTVAQHYNLREKKFPFYLLTSASKQIIYYDKPGWNHLELYATYTQKKRTGPIRITFSHEATFWLVESGGDKKLCRSLWKDLTEELRARFADRVTEKQFSQ